MTAYTYNMECSATMPTWKALLRDWAHFVISGSELALAYTEAVITY